ncbi:peptidase S8/S53 domain-containing protein [Trichoderma ceciliae]
MRALGLWSLASLVVGTASLGPEQKRVTDTPTRNTNAATNRYIIEIEKGSIAYMTRQFASPSSRNSTYFRQFDCADIFNGLVVETEIDNVDTLSAVHGVANVWPMKTVPMASAMPRVKAAPEAKHQNYSVHQWTGVDQLHAQGVRGKGVTIAIIDTGVDYTHEALGGCFGPGCKIAGGYDLVGTNWNSHDEKQYPKDPDQDPMDFHGHGTHVAGIIAAENEWLIGVAPDAQLLSFKVFADNPWDTDEDVLIQAFCDAYGAGADVITASIGRPDGFADDPWALIAGRIADKGVVVTISAGNEGNTGPFYSSSGANGHNVLSVAAINVTGNPNISTSDPRAAPIPALFTSWGPTNELLLKPDIGAPGFEIVSTVPDNNYESMSGTSMAAPYIAGIAALYISKNGGRELHGPGFAKMLANRIVSSGISIGWAADNINLDFRAPPFQVGTGLVNAPKVVNYDTQLAFEPFSLSDLIQFRSGWTTNVTNTGNQTVVYSFELEPQAGVEILDPHYGIKTVYQLEPLRIVPVVALPKDIVVTPGETLQVEFIFDLPKDISDDYLPLYGGKVWFRGSNGEDLSIPYGGAAYDTEKAFDTMFQGDPFVTDWGANWTWSFNPDKNRFDFIELSARLNYPCFHLRWDIYDSYWTENHWQYPPVVGKLGYVGSAAPMRDADTFWYYDPSRMNKDETVSFPLLRVPRGYGKHWWFGKLANGSHIAPGNYTMRFAALRPYGNPNISDHWDIMQMPVRNIEVLPYNRTNSTIH